MGVHTHPCVRTHVHICTLPSVHTSTHLAVTIIESTTLGLSGLFVVFCHTQGMGPLSLCTSLFHGKGRAVFKANSWLCTLMKANIGTDACLAQDFPNCISLKLPSKLASTPPHSPHTDSIVGKRCYPRGCLGNSELAETHSRHQRKQKEDPPRRWESLIQKQRKPKVYTHFCHTRHLHMNGVQWEGLHADWHHVQLMAKSRKKSKSPLSMLFWINSK